MKCFQHLAKGLGVEPSDKATRWVEGHQPDCLYLGISDRTVDIQQIKKCPPPRWDQAIICPSVLVCMVQNVRNTFHCYEENAEGTHGQY